jgi:O-antigen ligase
MKSIHYLAFLIFIISIFRIIDAVSKNKKKELFISLAIQIASLGYGFQLISFSDGYNVDVIGAFGSNIRIEFVSFVSLFLILVGYNKFDKIKIANKFLFFCGLSLIVISIFNPLNISKLSICPPISYYLQVWLLFHIINSNFNIANIFRGIYDAFTVLSFFQLALSICYPLLGIESVGTLFVDSLDSSLKREGVVSATGTYGHPGPLSVICVTYAVFFIICYWNNYKRKLSLYFFVANIFIIYLTYSRTTYLIVFLILVVAYNVHKMKLFKVRNIMSLIIASISLVVLLNYTPLGDMYFKSDSSEQVYNRTTHWLLGYELWQKSELVGIGINTHVLYMQTKLLTTKVGEFSDLFFFISNPIHNIHIIVLVETGLIGLFTWFYFFIYKLKQTHKHSYDNFMPVRILNITAFSSLLIVFTYGLTGWAVFLRETSVIFFLLIYYSIPSTAEKKSN